MANITLETLAARLAEVEKKLANLAQVNLVSKGWRSVVGISEENEFTRSVLAEIEANSDRERQEALTDG